MNILMLYGFAPHTTANYLARAFARQGHDVRSAGIVDDLSRYPDPYRLWCHDWTLEPGQRLDLGGWRPELTVWVESGDMGANGLIEARELGAPVAGWFIDTHNPGKDPWHQHIAPLLDRVFCAMRPAVDQYPGAQWLPLACDPEVHTPRAGIEKAFDLGYVGNRYDGGLYARRMQALRDLSRRYRVQFASGVYFEDMANVYGAAHLGWNMSLTGGDLVMRVFEVLCAGIPLVTDAAPESGLPALFDPDTEIVTYRDDEEMIAVIDSLLEDDGLRQQIGASGRAAVLAGHTYDHRARAIVEAMSHG